MSAIFPECPICFESLDHNLIASYCGHIFHQECFNTWTSTKNTMKCPICRRDSSLSLKLIYDIQFSSDNDIQKNQQAIQSKDRSTTIQSVQDIIKQNKKLSFQNEILKEQIEEMKSKQESIQMQIDESIEEFMRLEKSNKEIKNKALSTTFKLNESKEQCVMLKEELDDCHKRFVSLEKELKEKDEIIESNKAVGDLLNRNSKDNSVRDTIRELINKSDNGRSLNEYVYILLQRIDTLQEENERIKKQKYNSINSHQESIIKQVDTSTLITMIGNPINSKKRKYDDFLSEKNKMNQTRDVEANYQRNQNNNQHSQQNITKSIETILPTSQLNNSNNNINNNTIRLFNNPFTQKKGISLINHNK